MVKPCAITVEMLEPLAGCLLCGGGIATRCAEGNRGENDRDLGRGIIFFFSLSFVFSATPPFFLSLFLWPPPPHWS